MKKKEAIVVAVEFVEQKGCDTSQYDVTAKRVGIDWEIYFYRKEVYKPRPGDFLTVCVDGKSRVVRKIIEGK